MFLIIMIIVGIICAIVAHQKGRSVVGWFFIGFLLGIIGLVLVLVVSNLKTAREKEIHVEMEQRRLREQLRQEQIKSEKFRKYAQVRLDVHDKELKIDTRQTWNLPGQIENQPIMDDPREIGDREHAVNLLEKKIDLMTQCPHCLAMFRIPGENINKKATCPKCRNLFTMARFGSDALDEKCANCGKIIGKDEQTDFNDSKIVCKECSEKLRVTATGSQEKNEGWYYQHQNNTIGPLSMDMLKKLFEEEKINTTTYIWHKSLKTWTPAGDIIGPGGERGND